MQYGHDTSRDSAVGVEAVDAELSLDEDATGSVELLDKYLFHAEEQSKSAFARV